MPSKMYCLIGKDVRRSPSAAMMNAAFEYLGIDAIYTLENCKHILDAIDRTSRYDGFNVTMPFKVAIINFLDYLDNNAKLTGSVNTVKRSGNKLLGFNTDVSGAAESLRQHIGSRRLERVLIIGNGGVARSFLHVACSFGAKHVVILARNLAKAKKMSEQKFLDATLLDVMTFDDVRDSKLGRFDLIFNATPIGSSDVKTPKEIKDVVANCSIFFDAVYNPINTELIVKASSSGATIIFGHEMLLNQAKESFRILTDIDPPVKIMKRALYRALGVDLNDR